MSNVRILATSVALTALLASFGAAQAQIAVSANDGKVKLVDGAITVVENPTDTIAIIDLNATPPKLVAEIKAPASIVGPPSSVAIAADESYALVTSATKIDPADPKKTTPDDRVSIIDLKASPPVVLATVQAGKGAAGVAINPAGNLALVANRMEGTVTIFTIANRTLTATGKIELGSATSGPSAIAFTPDGKIALVSRDNDHKISVLSIDGAKVEYTKRDMNAGLRPYGLDISSKGDIAVVANIGIGTGDADTVSLLDINASPPRVIDTISVGQTPEGIALSPDGNFIAVSVMNGSNKPKNSPFYNEQGLLKILKIDGAKLIPHTEAKVGKWCQGIAWKADGKTVLAQCHVEQELFVFGFDGQKLTPGANIKVSAGPSGIRTATK